MTFFLQIPHLDGADEAEMEESLRSLSLEQDWVAVLEVPAGSSNTGSNPSTGQSVLDRVSGHCIYGSNNTYCAIQQSID